MESKNINKQAKATSEEQIITEQETSTKNDVVAEKPPEKNLLEVLNSIQTKGSQGVGSVQASSRLMKDLRDIQKSPGFQAEDFHVELVDDSVYEWNVKIRNVDPQSPLSEDLKKFKENEDKDHILLSLKFDLKFPFVPPFVRVVYPVLKGGFVLAGGAICMELLTSNGWSPATSINSLILQLGAHFVKGNARINFAAPPGHFTEGRAKQSFRSLSEYHDKRGWSDDPKKS